MQIKNFLIPLTCVVLANFSIYESNISFAKDAFLKSGITHSEFLPKIPESLSPGALFDKDNSCLDTQKPKFEWHRIPDALGGYWKSFNSKILNSTSSMGGYAGQNVFEEKSTCLGTLKDKKGNIWQCLNYPAVLYTNLNSNTPLFICGLTTFSKIIDSDDNTVTFMSRTLVTFVDRMTNRIVKNCQSEDIYTYESIDANRMKCIISSKTFDSNGHFIFQNTRESYYSKIGPFENQFLGPNNLDYKKSFLDYLNHYDLQDLIPE